MKKILCLLLFPILGFCQVQIDGDINGEAAYDQFGYSVAVSSDGSVFAVSSPYNTTNGYNAGKVRVYKNILGTLTQIGSDINGIANSLSGFSIALSADGNTLAVSAPFSSENGFFSGQVRVYNYVSENWIQIGNSIGGELEDESGFSISLSSNGSTLAIGARKNSVMGANSGRVRIYNFIENDWTQIGLDIYGEAVGDKSGFSISLSSDGNIIAIGADFNNGNGIDSGHVRVYRNTSDAWVKIGSDIDGESAGDRSGYSVALSSNGDTVAIGAIKNDGVNGIDSGHVRVYQNITDEWIQLGSDIEGETAGDYNGVSVGLSSNGNILAIGSAYYGTGQVKMYRNITGNWIQIGSEINANTTGVYSCIVALSNDATTIVVGDPANYGNGFQSGNVRVFDLSLLLDSNTFVNSNFSIFPNPTSDVLNIKLDSALELQKVNIYSISGQLLKTEKSSSFKIDYLSKGTYFIEVITDKGKATKTIVLE